MNNFSPRPAVETYRIVRIKARSRVIVARGISNLLELEIMLKALQKLAEEVAPKTLAYRKEPERP